MRVYIKGKVAMYCLLQLTTNHWQFMPQIQHVPALNKPHVGKEECLYTTGYTHTNYSCMVAKMDKIDENQMK